MCVCHQVVVVEGFDVDFLWCRLGWFTVVGFDVFLYEAVNDDDQLFAEGSAFLPVPFAVIEFEDGLLGIIGYGVNTEVLFGVGSKSCLATNKGGRLKGVVCNLAPSAHRDVAGKHVLCVPPCSFRYGSEFFQLLLFLQKGHGHCCAPFMII